MPTLSTMNRRIVVFGLVILSLGLSACSHGKKNPKESPAIATEVEAGFKQRWISKRTAEIQSQQNLRIDLARQQAIDEFNTKFAYTKAAQEK